MSIKINTNIDSLTAQRNLGLSQSNLSKTLEKLSSGLRINRSADNPADMSVGTQMKTISIGTSQAIENLQYAINYLQTADRGMHAIANMVQRIRELVIQAANDTYTINDREKIQEEIDQLLEGIDKVALHTEFNGIKPLQISPWRLKELTDIPGSCDISFIVDGSASMSAEINNTIMGLSAFTASLTAKKIDWRISVSEMGGATDYMAGNRAVDLTDWVYTRLDLTNDETAVNMALNDILANVNFKRVDPYDALLQVAGASPGGALGLPGDTSGDAAASGVYPDPDGPGPFRASGIDYYPADPTRGDDAVTRRIQAFDPSLKRDVKYFQIVLTDTVPESGFMTDGMGMWQADPFVGSELINAMTGMFYNDYPVSIKDGGMASNPPLYMGQYTPNFFASPEREAAVAARLAASGATVFVVTK